MGIKGLWRLLLPIGRRVSIETLEGKILAIDASIWLTQFIKAMRDPETGSIRPAAHLLGFVRRLCKLIFHGIRPVLVFDGPTPEIKLREVALRRKRRDQQQGVGLRTNTSTSTDPNTAIELLAKRILQKQLQKKKKEQQEAKTKKLIKNNHNDSNQNHINNNNNSSGSQKDGVGATSEMTTTNKTTTTGRVVPNNRAFHANFQPGDDDDEEAENEAAQVQLLDHSETDNGNQQIQKDTTSKPSPSNDDNNNGFMSTDTLATREQEEVLGDALILQLQQEEWLQNNNQANKNNSDHTNNNDWDSDDDENDNHHQDQVDFNEDTSCDDGDDNGHDGADDEDDDRDGNRLRKIKDGQQKLSAVPASRRRRRGHRSTKNNYHDKNPLPVALDMEQIWSLPSHERKDAIEQIERYHRMQSRREFMPVAGDMEQYSQVQINNFLRSAKFKQTMVQSLTQTCNSSNNNNTKKPNPYGRSRTRDAGMNQSQGHATLENTFILFEKENDDDDKREASHSNNNHQNPFDGTKDYTNNTSYSKRRNVPFHSNNRKKQKVGRAQSTTEAEEVLLVDTDDDGKIKDDSFVVDVVAVDTEEEEENEWDDHGLFVTGNSKKRTLEKEFSTTTSTHEAQSANSSPVLVGKTEDIAVTSPLRVAKKTHTITSTSTTTTSISPQTSSSALITIDADNDTDSAVNDFLVKSSAQQFEKKQNNDETFGESNNRDAIDIVDSEKDHSNAIKKKSEKDHGMDKEVFARVLDKDVVQESAATTQGTGGSVCEGHDNGDDDQDDQVDWEDGASNQDDDDVVVLDQNRESTQESSPMVSDANGEADSAVGTNFDLVVCSALDKNDLDERYDVDWDDGSVCSNAHGRSFELPASSSIEKSTTTIADSKHDVDDWKRDHRESQTTAALLAAQATAANLTNWAGRAFRRALEQHANETGTQLVDKPVEPSQVNSPTETNQDGMGSDPAYDFAKESKMERPRVDQLTKPNNCTVPPNLTSRSAVNISNDAASSNETSQVASVEQGTNLLALLEKQVDALNERGKRQERDMDTVTDEMKEDIVHLIQLFGIPYVDAPAEAEAQCVELERLGLVDGIVTEDSDVFVFGGRTVYKNIFDDQKYVEIYRADDAKKDLALGRNQFIALAMLLGGDYTEGVKGVGIVNGMEILQEFDVTDDLRQGLTEFREWLHGFGENDIRASAEFHLKHRSARTSWLVPDNFPADPVMTAYQHPVVDTSRNRFSWGVPDVENLCLFIQQNIGWTAEETINYLRPVMKKLEDGSRQTRIDSYFMKYEDDIKFAKVRSKRLRDVFRGIQCSKPEPNEAECVPNDHVDADVRGSEDEG